MFDIGFLELLVIGVLALVVLGPERLPGAMRSCISTIRSIKQMANGFKQEVAAQLDTHELHENLKKAEKMGMHNIGPDLQASVDELKAAAASVQQPYKTTSNKTQNNDEPAVDKNKSAPATELENHQKTDTQAAQLEAKKDKHE